MDGQTPSDEIQHIEQEIYQLVQRLEELRKHAQLEPIKNYQFESTQGPVSLLDLFADKQHLFAIHNMGQGCRYCTLWADGLNGFLPHLENQFAVVLLSKDAPLDQRKFANSRQWRFTLASHGGGEYIQEQSVMPGNNNMPGIVCYERRGDEICRKNASVFGPRDAFCSIWHILSLAGVQPDEWTPQYNYWQRPGKLDDGGENVLG